MATIVKPIRGGTRISFTGQRVPRIPPSFTEVVAVPIVHDWGPIGSDAPGADGKAGGAQLAASFAEFTQLYGDSDTEGRTAVAGAFQGHGLPDAGGAGGVLVYRMATAAAAAATVTLDNTTPAAALTLTARYAGTRGNELSVTVADDPSDAARDIFTVRYKGAVQETYRYANDDTAALVAAINTRSKLVTAVAEAGAGIALEPTAGTSLADGDNGAVLTSAEWLAAFDALEFGQFQLLSPYNLTDDGILASLKSWVQAQAAAFRPVMAVIGGAAGEVIDDALSRSADMNDPHIVNVGVGTYHDDLLDKDISTAQLAPRIAGVLAARGEESSAMFARLGGLHIVGDTGAPSDAIEVGITGGVMMLSRTMSTDAELKIENGSTTFTTEGVEGMPVETFGDARLVRVMDLFIRRNALWGDENVIGNLPVNEDTRSAVYGQVKAEVDELLRRGLILPENPELGIPAPFVSVEPPDDPNLLDSVPYDFGWQFARTTKYIFGQGQVL